MGKGYFDIFSMKDVGNCKYIQFALLLNRKFGYTGLSKLYARLIGLPCDREAIPIIANSGSMQKTFLFYQTKWRRNQPISILVMSK